MVSENAPALKQLIDSYKEIKRSVVGVKEVEESLLKNYGVISGAETKPGLFHLDEIVEKPKNKAPSKHAVIGRYVFTPTIFTMLEKAISKEGEEIQLTDAIKELLAVEDCYGKVVNGQRYDIGRTEEYVALINRIHQLEKRSD
jgi:UTP--glucose-1-phosphate uridylyltransferase